MFNDLKELAADLDEHIEKGLALEKKKSSRVEQLKKGLSHDPFRPHEMGFESPYYNPYKFSPNEGFMPYEASHWEALGKNPDNYLTTTQLYNNFNSRKTNIKDRTGGIFDVDKSIGGLKDLSKSLARLDLIKAGAVPLAKPAAPKAAASMASGSAGSQGLPIGTVHTYADGNRYKKIAQGQWVPLAGMEERGHSKWLAHFDPNVKAKANQQLEQHAQAHSDNKKKIQDELDKRHSTEEAHRAAVHTMASEMLKYKKLDPEFKDHLKKIKEAHSDKTHKKEIMSGAEKQVAKQAKSTKPHYVDIKFSHKGKMHSHTMKNIEATDPKDAEKKATEGMAQISALRGHEIKSVKAREAERLPQEGIYHPKESLGVKRKDMPQITEEAQKDFMQHLKDQGVEVTTGKMKISEMKPSQDEMDAGKASDLKNDPHLDKPIIVSKDDYIMDGHHRWLAARMKDEDQKANVIKVDMNGKELLDVMRKYPESFSTDIKDNPSIPFKEGDVTTAEAFKNDKGEYKMARKELHENIIRSHIDNVKSVPPPEGQKPVLILTGGGSGSGKSAVLGIMREAMKQDAVTVDADEIKKSIPEYNKWVKEGNDNAAALAHDESSDLSIEMMQRAFKEGKPVIYDGTMKNVEKYKKLIESAKKAGYIVHAGFADCPLEVCKQRAEERAKKTGRKVPMSVIEESNKGAIAAFHQLVDQVDSATVYSTHGKPPPKQVYKKEGANIEKDEEAMKDLRARGHMLKSEPAKSDVLDKFHSEIGKMSGEYDLENDFDDEYRDDPDFDKQIKYEGESNEQGHL